LTISSNQKNFEKMLKNFSSKFLFKQKSFHTQQYLLNINEKNSLYDLFIKLNKNSKKRSGDDSTTILEEKSETFNEEGRGEFNFQTIYNQQKIGKT
jgi:hypothetical protein